MIIVLDTNILVSNFNLTNSTFKVFLNGLKDAGHSLFTLQIVIDETVNKYRESLYKLKQDEEKLNNESQRLTNEKRNLTFSELWIENKVNDYQRFLKKTFKHSAEFNAKLIGYPEIYHEDLVKKALSRKKPFSIKGTGYRDALIWENILWISETYVGSEKLAFISQNTKDFADENFTLHSDLAIELDNKGLDRNMIIFYSSLEDFVSEQITTKYEELNLLKEQLNQNSYTNLDFKRLLEISLEENLSYLAKISNKAKFTHDFNFEYEELNLKGIERIISYNVTDARRTNSMTKADILLNIEIDAECILIVYLQKSILDKLQNNSWLTIQEDDLNRVRASFKALINFSLDTFFRENSDESDEVYLSGIGSININNIKTHSSEI